MRRIIKFSLFLSLVFMSYVCFANEDMDFSSNFEKEKDLLERITKLQAQVKDIKGQYISITSQLEKIQFKFVRMRMLINNTSCNLSQTKKAG